MEEDEGEPNKIVRITPESLIVKHREDEETYRRKYLPDPTKLPDEKLVCTVCSKSLAQDVHGGKDIFAHRSLRVLVCEECYLFYGNGCFSTDEDGDDKYCRWCGQGGTLFLCSACTCGFCNKCAEKNLKSSALEELKQDDWKCLICAPRPIYGLRAIFWAARHLNNIGKAIEKEKLKERTEKLKILAEEKRSPKIRKTPATEKYRNGKDESISTKRKHYDEDSDSSTVSIPYKKHKNQSVNDNSLNGSLRQSHSSDITSDDERSKKKLSSKKGKKKIKKYETSSSEEESAVKRHKHKKKKEAKYTTESSTDDERKSPNHKHHVKRKRKKQTDTTSSSDDTVERRRKKKKQKDTSDNSTDSEMFTKKDKVMSKKVHNKKHKRKEQSKHEEELSSNSDSSEREKKKDTMEKSSKSDVPDEENKIDENKEKQEGVNCSEASDVVVNDVKPNDQDSDATLLVETQIQVEEKTELVDGCNLNGPETEVSQPEDYKESDLTAVPLESTEETPASTTDIDPIENTEQTIKAAITWLCGVVGDISEIGSLVAKRADSLFEKKINIDSFKSYDDVLLTLDKIKLFMDGIHKNYNEVENNIDAKFSSWKVAAGLEEIDSEKTLEEVLGIETSEQNKDLNNAAQKSNDVDESTDQNTVHPSSDDKMTDDVEKKLGEESVSEALLAGDDIKIEVPLKEIENGVEISLKELNIGDKLEELGSTLTNTDADNEVTTPGPDLEDGIKEDIVQNENEDGINETEIPPDLKDGIKENIVPNENEDGINETEMPPDLEDGIKEDIVRNKNEDGINETEMPPDLEDGIKEDIVRNENEDGINETEMPPENENNKESSINDGIRSVEESKDDGEKMENKDQSEQEVNTFNDAPHSTPNKLEESVKENKDFPDEPNEEGSPSKLDSKSNEALQELLYSSSDEEINQSDSDSDESGEIELDDSDLEIKKPNKNLVKAVKKTENISTDKNVPEKCTAKKDNSFKKENSIKKEHSVKKEDIQIKEENELEEEEIVDVNDGEVEDESEMTNDKEVEEESQKQESAKSDEDLDSEAEIDMLTDLTKLKKKMPSRKVFSKDSSEDEDNSEESDSEDSDDVRKSSKKRKEYKKECKKRRELERNELFGFLERNSSNEDGEMDISKKDLDVIENQYSSSDSMSLEEFSQRMNVKWKELEKQQDQMNLQMLLASDSDEGPVEEGDAILESEEENNKKKKAQKNKVKEEKVDTNEVDEENKEDDKEIAVNEEKDKEQEQENEDNDKIRTDDEYEQFLEGIVNSRTEFKGLGSSSEQSDQDNDVTITNEPVSDDTKNKKGSRSEIDISSESDSDDSADLFLDKKKSLKKKSWRTHRLLRIKLSDTDTSDEERWWKRKLEKEQKKKEERGSMDSDSSDFARNLTRPSKSLSAKSKSDDGSDKENKKKWKKKAKNTQDKDDGSSTMDLSSTESSGSDIFKRKKKKKKSSTDSDINFNSDEDNKKKKKKKRGSSDESNDSDDDVIDITQKSSQGESPGKGGRKNIRKVLTKHELAAATKAAAKEEEERRKRIATRQKQYNEMFEIKEAEILEKLVLDFDPDTKTELISVDKDLVVKMKPHQAKGVKFMWDSCFESLTQLKTKKGSGCILAHCMGLGKTFQVISLVHTILKHEDTRVRTVLVVCPLSTVLNWASEFRKWLDDVDGGKDILTYHFTTCKRPHERAMRLQEWQRKGGVMILGYEMFRILTNEVSKKFRLTHRNIFQTTLIDPGADLVVCDEGHMLKNESTVLSKAMSRIRTLRRIVLTGTPMQNNLKEYHCMVQFVKPNLLGTRKEFLNQFVNPITNGQFVDSTEGDVKVMKRRSHVLHKMLEGLVQRFDYTVLTPFLPPKHEYVVSLRLSEVQVKLYQFYLEHFSQLSNTTHSGSKLFPDWQALGRIWTHPRVLKMSTDKAEKEREKKRLEESEEEEEGSIKAFIDDRSSLSVSSSGSSSSSDGDDSDKSKKKKKKQPAPSEKKDVIKVPEQHEIEINLISSDEEEIVSISKEEEGEKEKAVGENLDGENKNVEGRSDIEEEIKLVEEEEKNNSKGEDDSKGETENEAKGAEVNTKNEEENKTDNTKKSEVKPLLDSKSAWWKPLIEPEHLDDINQSAKLIMLFAILRECEMIEDKILVFSQSLFSLDLIEYFLKKVDEATEESRLEESLGNQVGSWTRGLDYFRLDGSSSSENRSAWCKSFNREDNPRARLFLISTRAGGLGINLTAANRVVIFDASWNPSHDVQSIFRIYRFGQKKPCYIYRFIASGTMEEKVYDRQVAKQSLSSRVVDEQQVHRHFSSNDLTELYKFTPPAPRGERPTPSLPKDRLMAELLTQYSEWIEKYHEHDSLLENVVEEELNEEERKLAWEDYENDKKQGFLPTPGTGNFQNAANINHEEFFRKSLRLKYPNASEPELNAMLQTLLFQVNSNKFVNISQLPQQTQLQANASTSQVGAVPNFRMTTPNSNSASQQFVNMRNHVYQKYGQYAQPNIGKRMGNGEIKKQAQNLANAQSNVSNIDAMRRQQEAELARVKRQQAMGSLAQSSAQLNNIYQNNRQNPQAQTMKQRQQQTPQPMNNRQQSRQIINNRQQQPQAASNGRQMDSKHNQWPVQRLNSVQQRQPIQNQPANNRGFQSKNTMHNQNQLKRSVENRFVNNKQLQVIPVNQKQPPQKSEEQIRKEIVSRIQQQRQLAERQKQQVRQAAAGTAAAPPTFKRQLEDMKNRYKASRTKLQSNSTPIIVEIDDDPVEPSGSAS